MAARAPVPPRPLREQHEKIPMQKINEAYDRMLKSDVKYRFVIDLASLKEGSAAA